MLIRPAAWRRARGWLRTAPYMRLVAAKRAGDVLPPPQRYLNITDEELRKAMTGSGSADVS